MPDHSPDNKMSPGSGTILLHVAFVLLRRKWLIILATATIFSIAFSIYSAYEYLFSRDQYYSQCLIAPVDIDLSYLQDAFRNPKLTYAVIDKKNLLDDRSGSLSLQIQADEKATSPLSRKEACNLLLNALALRADEKHKTLQVDFRWPYAEMCPRILGYYLEELPSFIEQELSAKKRRDLDAFPVLIDALRKELNQAEDVILKEKIADNLVKYISLTVEMKRTNFVYIEVIDPASPSQKVTRPVKYGDRVYLWIALSFIIAVMLAFLVDSLAIVKAKHPEKIEALKKLLTSR
jgi:hypothetical protein